MHINRVFELSMVLDTEDFQKIYDPVYSDYEDETQDEYVDHSMDEKGIQVIYRNSQYKKKIRLIVYPSIIENSASNTDKFIRKLEKRISEYFHSRYGLDDFTLSKMHLTSDIDVESRKNVSAYLKALRRVGKVKGFTPTEYDCFEDGSSFCMKGNGHASEFLIYDLERNIMHKLAHADISEKEFQTMLHNAKGVLRAEVRLTKPKSIRPYTTGYSISEQIAELSKDCQRIFMDTFARIIPYGDFYKKGKASEIIRKEVKSSVMRRKMLHLLALVPEKRSLLLAQKATHCRQNDAVMLAFAKINLSPVTLSKRFDGKYLKNLYTYNVIIMKKSRDYDNQNYLANRIRKLYSPGFSSLELKFFNGYLSLNFVPYSGSDNTGDYYAFSEHLSTTINFEGAAALFFMSKVIMEGSEHNMEFVLPCNHDACLHFEYKPDENNQMTAYLSIEKNQRIITYKFNCQEYFVSPQGQKERKIFHAGLSEFVMALRIYLTNPNTDVYFEDMFNDDFAFENHPGRVK